MSSSDKFPDWDKFAKREAPEVADLLSPASEVAADLQKFHAKLLAVRNEVEEAGRDGIAPLAQLAVLVFKIAAALEKYKSELESVSQPKADVFKTLRVLKDQMQTVLNEAGIEIIAPLGRPYEEVADFVNVMHWRHHEQFTAEVVAEVLEPIVKRRGQAVHLAHLIMGAPPKPEEPAASTNVEISAASEV
ncbi:hypothetical protein HUU05_08510 [candidate division KSB1 bacterium]|nr:hypothetical protein [candidate division KSB1 bacterium]